jgi:hypothetical protein
MFWVGAMIAEPVTPSGCAECHADIARRQFASRHALTLAPYAKSPLARVLASSGADAGGFRYEYTTSGVTARRNSERATASLEWAFGAGGHGMTAVGQYDGLYFEHRLSYYALPGATSLTPGHPEAPPRSAADALGVLKLPQDIYKCFDCHSTNLRPDAGGGPELSRMTAGVTCERCHGPGERHSRAAQVGLPPVEIAKAIFNAARLPAKAQVEFCGGCHRLPDASRHSQTPEIQNPLSVRFQPIGLMASRCFRESGRLSCLICHDPHEDAKRDPAFYVGRCLTCHEGTGSPIVACRRREPQDCAPCHMRKATPLPNLTFTDHRIRLFGR